MPKSSRPDAAQLRQRLARSVQHLADATVQLERRYVDSLAASTKLSVGKAQKHLDSFVDSLVISARDSLDAGRRDSLRLKVRSLQQELASAEGESRTLLNASLSRFIEQLSKGRKEFSVCSNCESESDFDDQLGYFKGVVDSLRENFRDETSSLMDEQTETLQDKYESLRDSLVDVRDNLIDRRLNEIDMERYRSSRFVISSGYSGHNSYRGRDNGLPQQMIAPSIEYRHSSGFSIAASTYWLDKTPKKWDEFQLSAGYEFNVSEVVGISFSYTHFWFSDSSRSAQSVFKNAVGAGLSLDWPVASFGANADLAMGTASEFTVATSVSHPFEIPLSLYNRIMVEPTLTAFIGEQNSDLTTLRIKRVKGKKVVSTQTQVNNFFGILDYEVSLPVSIELAPVTLSPAVTYIIPLNVIDESTATGFLSFEFDIRVKLQ